MLFMLKRKRKSDEESKKESQAGKLLECKLSFYPLSTNFKIKITKGSVKNMSIFNIKTKVGVFISSLPLSLGTNGITCRK